MTLVEAACRGRGPSYRRTAGRRNRRNDRSVCGRGNLSRIGSAGSAYPPARRREPAQRCRSHRALFYSRRHAYGGRTHRLCRRCRAFRRGLPWRSRLGCGWRAPLRDDLALPRRLALGRGELSRWRFPISSTCWPNSYSMSRVSSRSSAPGSPRVPSGASASLPTIGDILSGSGNRRASGPAR